MPPPIVPVILCGGSGTRLWPVSRASYPKQFGRLTGAASLFQAAVTRLPSPPFAAPVVVTGAEFRFIVTEQLGRVGRAAAAVLIEPEPKNTAPAVLAAALSAAETAPDALLLVCPSDHAIADAEAFRAAVRAGAAAAAAGRLVTFGVRPERAETGYGWLELAEPVDPAAAPAPLPLVRFVEKPDAARAAAMLEGGRHLWNSGIFLFAAGAIIAAFEQLAPRLLAAVRQAVEGATPDLDFLRLEPGRLGGGAEHLDRLRGHGAGGEPRGGALRRRLVRPRRPGTRWRGRWAPTPPAWRPRGPRSPSAARTPCSGPRARSRCWSGSG